MSMNFNCMNNMAPMGGMPGMGSMMGMGMMGGAGNTHLYFKQKYGCEDCFRKEPYWQEYPKPVLQEPGNTYKRNWFQRLLYNITGG